MQKCEIRNDEIRRNARCEIVMQSLIQETHRAKDEHPISKMIKLLPRNGDVSYQVG